jgi:glycosyltransferase 2 family protein
VLGIAGVLLFSRVYIGRRERDRRERGLVRRLVRDTVERLAEPLGRRHIVVWLSLSVGAWGMWAIAAFLIARSLGVDLSFTEALFVTAVLNLGSAVPSSPGYVGTYEWLGVASLGLLDVDHEPALAFTILVHAAWYVPTTLFGAIALGLRGATHFAQRRSTRGEV